MINQHSFAIGGFWYHLSPITSIVYRDQHYSIWILQNNRFVSECGGRQSGPVEKKNGWVSSDDIFMQERENWASFFNNRYYKSL